MRACVRVVVLWCLLGTALVAADVRVSNYRLDVTFSPESSRLQGVAQVSFAPGSTGSVVPAGYLHGELRVDSIVAAGQSISYSPERVWYDHNYSLTALRFQIDTSYRISDQPLVIYYHGPMHPSAARSPSDYMRIAPDGVYLRAYGYSLWFPVFLESDAQEYEADFDSVTLRVPEGYVAVFAGRNLSSWTDSIARRSIWIWQANGLSLHGAQCAAFPGTRQVAGSVVAYCRHDGLSLQSAEKVLGLATSLQRRYADWYCAPSLMAELHIVQMPPYGDIAGANVVGLSEEVWSAFDTLSWAKGALAHELVHAYVRPEIDFHDSLAAMVIEGFPSYLHWPVLAELWGEEWYNRRIKRTEQEYLQKLAQGIDRWGALPPKKPLLAISYHEIGEYKDRFLLDDRALLMLHDLYRRMGKARFKEFARDLCSAAPLTLETFESTCLRYAPRMRDDLRLWLRGTDYPEHLRLKP